MLGHLLRGGTPTSFDRLLGLRFGAAAVRALEEGHDGVMVALDPPTVLYVPLAEATSRLKVVPLDCDTLLTARDMGINFGDAMPLPDNPPSGTSTETPQTTLGRRSAAHRSLRPWHTSTSASASSDAATSAAAFVGLIAAQAKEIEARTGVALEVTRVAVRNLARDRDVELAPGVLTRDAHDVVADPDVDVVVEVIGGIEPARELIATALAGGKPVVTANKELLANVGVELFNAADHHGVDLLFEAAVAGGIPLVRALRESLRGEPVRRIVGIVNGTTNYILTKMTEQGAAYGDALARGAASGLRRA